jgi:hypothetical protein
MSPDQRSRLFGEVNDRIYDLLESADPDLPGEFLCECGRDCGRRVELLPAAFATLRAGGGIARSSECRESRSRARSPRGDSGRRARVELALRGLR